MNRRRKILTCVALALGVAIVLAYIHHLWLRRSTKAYIAHLKAQGVPLELAQVIPLPVPSEENAAPLITNALAQIISYRVSTNCAIDDNPPYDMNRAIPGKELVGWRQPVIHSPDTSPSNLTNTWKELGAQLAGIQDDLNDCRKLIRHPLFDFHYNYSDPQDYGVTLMSHLPAIKIAVEWLEVSEFYDLHRGRTADACTDVRAMLAFVKGETGERFLISQLVRIAVATRSADATWNLLQATNVTDDDLVPLQQDWQSLKFTVPLKNAFLFERVSELQLLNSLQKSPASLASQVSWMEELMSGGKKMYKYVRTDNGRYVLADESTFLQRVKHDISIHWDEFQWSWFWLYADEVRGLQMWQAIIDGTSMLETNKSFPSAQSSLEMDFNRFGFNSVKNNPYAIISQNADIQLSAIRKLAKVETVRNTVITAIALKRYELGHHHFPDRLSELVPEFLNSVPTDYMDGQPLHYRRNADGTFLLYSVGENGKDDGGNPALETNDDSSDYYWLDPEALDWVWPQPATPKEIKAYYDQLAKNR